MQLNPIVFNWEVKREPLTKQTDYEGKYEIRPPPVGRQGGGEKGKDLTVIWVEKSRGLSQRNPIEMKWKKKQHAREKGVSARKNTGGLDWGGDAKRRGKLKVSFGWSWTGAVLVYGIPCERLRGARSE